MSDSQFARPELPQLIATIRSDLLTRFQQDVVLRRMVRQDSRVINKSVFLALGIN
ncbi:TPA_asm: phage baseplate protein, partial [Salmonella enterica subsp. enterica serovar Abortusovis]|nr:phage baseplate protein [Salmonella enterica subsp. enterica serovar Abortusovis]HAE8721697.1 phage baseplate protein [Salmonella enterica subsp. enterica serovar Abortusovis]